MRKFLIPLMLICSVQASAQFRLSPEHRVAPFTLGPISAGRVTVVPTGTGYTAFWSTLSTLAQVPIAADATPDLASRQTLGASALVVVAAGHALRFWSDDTGAIYSATEFGQPRQIARGTAGSASCDDGGCLLTYADESHTQTLALPTDTEGFPIGPPVALADFNPWLVAVGAMAGDPNGFFVERTGYRMPGLLIRLDRLGNKLFDRPLALPGSLVWTGDHDVAVGATSVNNGWWLSAADVDANGNFGPARQLVQLLSPSVVFAPRDGGYVVASQSDTTVSLFNVDSNFTTAAPAGSFAAPVLSLAAVAANGTSTIAILGINGALYSVNANGTGTPSLLTYGALTQTARGIAKTGSEFFVVWTETGTESDGIYGAHMSTDGVARDRITFPGRATIGFHVEASGNDVLVTWFDYRLFHQEAAIAHADGTLTTVDAGNSSLIRDVVATNDGWRVIAGATGFALDVLAITRAGLTLPAVPIPASGPFVAADSDGSILVIATGSEAIAIGADGTVLRRVPLVTTSIGTMAFDGESYLLADDHALRRLNRTGETIETLPHAVVYPTWPLVGSVSIGWIAGGEFEPNVTTAERGANLAFGPTLPAPHVLAMTRHGDGDAGLLFAHDAQDGIDRGAAVFLRDVRVVVPRRHSVATR